VVLDRNLFEIPVTDIKSERVQETYFRGRRVYRRAAAPK
jgi:predicted amidohydrolase YtcJ